MLKLKINPARKVIERTTASPTEKPHAASGRLRLFKDVLHAQMRTPPAYDERIAAYAEALATGLDKPGPLRDFFNELLSIRHDISSSHLATKTLRAAQKQLLGNYPDYPRAFLTPGAWREGLDWIFDDPDRAADFTVDIWVRPLQSNVSDRYKGVKALGVLARRFGRLDNFNVLDIGCSQNAGLNHLASGLNFGMPSVITAHEASHVPDLQYMAEFHRALATDLPLDWGVGVDVYDPEDSRSWAWSCSHYPTELLDEKRIALFEALIGAHYENVEFFQGNFAQFDTARFNQAYPNPDFGVVNFSTVLYQADQSDRDTMLATAGRYARDFVVVQDFLRIDPDDPGRLLFRDDWQDDPFPYRMVARDIQEGSGHWHDLLQWRDGRCRELAIGMGQIATKQGSLVSMGEALQF